MSAEIIPLGDTPVELVVTRAMTTPQMFARALPRAAVRSQGRLKGAGPLQALRVRHSAVRLEPERLEAYRQVCTYRAEPGLVPLPYPEVHFTPLMAEAIVSARFPLSPLGLIHIRQQVRSHVALMPGDRVDATTELAEIRHVERGYEVDFSMALHRRSTLVWSGLATLLSRSPRARSGRSRAPHPTPDLSETLHTKVLDVPECTGRDYARASGDWNPHHLWTFTARPLGYRQPIAHGMWTFARGLAEALSGLSEHADVEATADFKKPLLMPGRMRMDIAPLGPGGESSPLRVTDPETGAPYLLGECGFGA